MGAGASDKEHPSRWTELEGWVGSGKGIVSTHGAFTSKFSWECVVPPPPPAFYGEVRGVMILAHGISLRCQGGWA